MLRGCRQGLRSRILVPVPEVSGVPEPPVVPNFIAGLEKLEMDVVRVGAYATRPVAKGHNEVEIMLLLAVRIPCATHSSS